MRLRVAALMANTTRKAPATLNTPIQMGEIDFSPVAITGQLRPRTSTTRASNAYMAGRVRPGSRSCSSPDFQIMSLIEPLMGVGRCLGQALWCPDTNRGGLQDHEDDRHPLPFGHACEPLAGRGASSP